MILTSGGFDGLHAGHVQYLTAAKALCEPDEVLCCAIAPDRYLATKGRPARWTQADRLRTVRALECVDAVVAHESPSIASLIRDYRPRLFVKGPDWQDRLPADVPRACEDVGTSIAYVDTPGRHVSETIPSDEEALARFEALVQSQQPARQPWTPVTDYSFEARKAIEGRHPELITEVFSPTQVFDVGCGAGHLVQLLRDRGVNAYGGDLHPPAEERTGQDRWFVRCDVTEYYTGQVPLADLVICREVLEHLTIRQIRVAVKKLCALSSRYVYLTTRFAKAPTHLLDVDTADDLDPTHMTMLNQSFLRTLFVLEGFKRRADLEERLDWQRKGRVLVYERP